MDVKFVGVRGFKGFSLKKDFVITCPVSVVIGKNGCGKTRLFESIRSGGVNIISEHDFDRNDVFVVPHSGLIPKLESRYSASDASARTKSLLEIFRKRKLEFDSPVDRLRMEAATFGHDANRVNFKEAHAVIGAIAKKVSKIPSELSDDEIGSHYDGYGSAMFGAKNLTAIFTRYIKRLHDNEYAMWLSQYRGKQTYHVSDELFESVYGRQPWVVLNEILNEAFNGKIKVGIPSGAETGEEYVASFFEGTSGAPLTESDLSSGEQTLLWLALVMFVTQFSSNSSETPPKILLMDEPDAFLHPSMVIQLLKFLESFSHEFSAKVIITSHSPTTVALSPENSIYALEDGQVTLVDKDLAIATLLDGVSQISVNPYNRRLVLVESHSDAEIYQLIYAAICHKPLLLDPKVTVTFVSSGPKMPRQQISDKIKQVFGEAIEKDKIDEFIRLVNGVGSCEQVTGMVESLASEGDATVRGLIDWDRNNTSQNDIIVLGEGVAYALENVALDPICIMLLLHIDLSDRYPVSTYCGTEIGWTEWMRSSEILQKSLDWFVSKVLGDVNLRDAEIEYISDVKLLTDKRYLGMNGHCLADKLLAEFDGLRGLAKGKAEGLMRVVVKKSMLSLSEGRFIPKIFSQAFSELQGRSQSRVSD